MADDFADHVDHVERKIRASRRETPDTSASFAIAEYNGTVLVVVSDNDTRLDGAYQYFSTRRDLNTLIRALKQARDTVFPKKGPGE